ncbi:hypothetical protein BDZ89DRAFT_345653 [Hymenopellis radicata]|nr:hypothetical protein BDZ89DRAFT_345653 [Hymenopellis radicata]
MDQRSQPRRQKTLPSSGIDTPANAPYQPVVLAYHPPQPEAVQRQISRPILRSQSPSSSSKGHGEHHSKSNGNKIDREKRLDLIDELDETNPLGMRFHNGGPYEAIQKVVSSHSTADDRQNRAHLKHKNWYSADAAVHPSRPLPYVPQHTPPPQRPPYQHQSHSQHSDQSQQSGHSQMPMHRYMAPAVNEFNPYDARPHRASPQLHASPAPAQGPIPAARANEPSDPYYADAMDESDAYGGIMEDPMPPYRNVRNSVAVPRPAARSTPDLNLQRANTDYTRKDNYMGRHPNNSQPSFIRQERSNGMIRQPTNGTPYNAPARLPNNNGYDYGRGQYPDLRHPYQAPPQQHLPPPQQYQDGPPPPDRYYASSVQQSVTSSSSQRNGPQPLHIPRNLVMPTPLQNSPQNSSPHHVDPRHQMNSSYAESSAGQPRGPLAPSQLYRQHTNGNLPPNAYPAYPTLQKGSSMTQVRQPHSPTSVSFAANYVEPAAMKKPARRVLSKKR